MELQKLAGIVRFGAFELDRNSGELRKSGLKIHLREQPFRILAMLLERPGEIITREEIQKILWPNDTVVEFEHSINAAIKALRVALGDDADNPRFVETLPRRGYRFIAPVDGIVAAVYDRRPVNETEKPAFVTSGSNPQPEDGAHRAPLQNESGARYGLLEKLGAGGMGEVWRARDTKLNRDVALKFLPEDLSSDRAALERFKREAQLASSLNHPHICSIYDTGELDGRQFISMEFVEGETLAPRLAGTGRVATHAVIPAQAGIQPMPELDPHLREGDDKRRAPLPLDTVLEYGIEIAGALAAAHRLGIIHRDLKPQNIMLTKSGTKLLDFGLAKVAPGFSPARADLKVGATMATAESLTAQGAIMGTLHYMAPEQLEGKPADARSDIFAFGCVLYEMATGKRAFEGESSAQVLAAIMKNDPPPITNVGPNGVRPLGQLDAPYPVGGERRSPLQRVVMKCLAKDPDERWQSAADLKEALKWIKEGDATNVGAGLVPALDQPPHASSSPSKGHPQGVPLQRVVMKCLAKDPGDRWQSAADLRDELKWIVEAGLSRQHEIGASSRQTQDGGVKPPLQRAMPWVAGIVLGSILTGLIVWRLGSPQATTPSPVTRFAITLPSGDQLANMQFPTLALSPDGSELVYAVGHGDVSQLYLR